MPIRNPDNVPMMVVTLLKDVALLKNDIKKKSIAVQDRIDSTIQASTLIKEDSVKNVPP